MAGVSRGGVFRGPVAGDTRPLLEGGVFRGATAADERPLLERRLATYLAQAARQPQAWGDWDCAVGLCAGWVQRLTDLDPAADLRGRYRTARQAADLIAAAGGLAGLFDPRLARLGIFRTEIPAVGDLGVVLGRSPAGLDQAGAIRTRRGWAVLGANGVRVSAYPTVAAWGL